MRGRPHLPATVIQPVNTHPDPEQTSLRTPLRTPPRATLRTILSRFAPLLIPLLVALLYGAFLNNPLVFDDLYFFLPGNPEKYVAEGFQLRPRWLASYSHGLTFTLIGEQIVWQRIGNLLLHAATGLALYALLRRLLTDLLPPRAGALDARWAALIAALLFVLHPAAVYAAGYLIQRSIVMATLFSLLSWLAFWRGLNGSRPALWASAALYALALLSKEHAVMAPAICAALLVLHRRSGLKLVPGRLEIAALAAVQLALAVFVTLAVKRVLGTAYEPLATEMLGALDAPVTGAMAYPLSVLTQAGLFFKYLLLWIVPNGAWMSVDMREPFATQPVPLQNWALLAAFIAYPFAAFALLWRGRSLGLIGLALLAPWLLFATEISSVRLQEVFVLYRSYLWMPLPVVIAGLGIGMLSHPLRTFLAALILVAAALMAWSRLTSFSDAFFLWDDAAELVENRKGLTGTTGVERIYHNRGLALHAHGMTMNAISDLSKAVDIKPDYADAYSDRGSAFLAAAQFDDALHDFDTAIRLDSRLVRAFAGRALALEKSRQHPEAYAAHLIACQKGWKPSCAYRSDSLTP